MLAGLISIGSEDDTETTDVSSSEQVNLTESVEPEEIVISEDEYKAQCIFISYDDIARNPDSYIGEMAMFVGQVIQVQENGKNVVLRVDVTQGEYGIWEDTVYVDYYREDDTESRVLEDDIITMYGELNGIKSYTTVLGSQVSIPHFIAEYIEIN